MINHAPFLSDPDGTCALHVHISLSAPWTPARVRRLALAILRYGPQLAQLARKVGRTGRHVFEQAVPNSIRIDAPDIRKQQHLDTLETTRDIVEALCPKDTKMLLQGASEGKGEEEEEEQEQEQVRPPRHYFWNLWPLVGLGFDENEGHFFVKQTGTVEFRLPPSPKTDADAAAWVDFVNLFVLAAVDGGGGDDSSLLLFVQSRGERLGVPAEDLDRVAKLLVGLE